MTLLGLKMADNPMVLKPNGVWPKNNAINDLKYVTAPDMNLYDRQEDSEDWRTVTLVHNPASTDMTTEAAILDPENAQALRNISQHDSCRAVLVQEGAVQPLVQLCLENLVQQFEDKPILDELPGKYRRQLLERLSTAVPLTLTAPHIEDDTYWERCARTRRAAGGLLRWSGAGEIGALRRRQRLGSPRSSPPVPQAQLC